MCELGLVESSHVWRQEDQLRFHEDWPESIPYHHPEGLLIGTPLLGGFVCCVGSLVRNFWASIKDFLLRGAESLSRTYCWH